MNEERSFKKLQKGVIMQLTYKNSNLVALVIAIIICITWIVLDYTPFVGGSLNYEYNTFNRVVIFREQARKTF